MLVLLLLQAPLVLRCCCFVVVVLLLLLLLLFLYDRRGNRQAHKTMWCCVGFVRFLVGQLVRSCRPGVSLATLGTCSFAARSSQPVDSERVRGEAQREREREHILYYVPFINSKFSTAQQTTVCSSPNITVFAKHSSAKPIQDGSLPLTQNLQPTWMQGRTRSW